jgi:CRP/FNR family transcriptional regulator, cyclic AMP receptor protein
MHLTCNEQQVSVVGTSKPDEDQTSLQRSLDAPILAASRWLAGLLLGYYGAYTAMADSAPAIDPRLLARNAPLGERAAELLAAPSGLMSLTLDEARAVVDHMTPRYFAANTTFFTEGDDSDEGFMAMVLKGEVVVESITVSRTVPLTLKVLGPGSLVGEVGFLDQGPRLASCTTSTDTLCAVLTRQAIETLIAREPRIGAKLMMAIATFLAERLRDNSRKLKLYTKLAQAMQQEIDLMIRR